MKNFIFHLAAVLPLASYASMATNLDLTKPSTEPKNTECACSKELDANMIAEYSSIAKARQDKKRQLGPPVAKPLCTAIIDLCNRTNITPVFWCNNPLFSTCEGYGEDRDGDGTLSEANFIQVRYDETWTCSNGQSYKICGTWLPAPAPNGHQKCCVSEASEPACTSDCN